MVERNFRKTLLWGAGGALFLMFVALVTYMTNSADSPLMEVFKSFTGTTPLVPKGDGFTPRTIPEPQN